MRTAGIIFITLFMLAACTGDNGMAKYNSLVKKELASNKRVDSIFFGIHFGMTQKEFFMHCWEMNKKGILTDGNDGTGSMYVLYKLDKELKYPASMNFYPDFNDSTIWKMPVSIHYNGWAPWNKKMGADSLLSDVFKLYKKWYSDGNSFIQLNDKRRGILYIKVDGNRRITIGKYDDVIVRVEYVDMLVEKQKRGKDEK
ncbi:MAG: hypothetical protein ABIN97_04055 [Ginsengibacter sp.]